jgi:outer membrane receptor protein involved in Fe transport
MRGKGAFASLAASALVLAVTAGPLAHAQGARALRIDTTGQSLATALTDIARRSGRELLLAAPMVGGRAAPSLRGQYTIDQALTLLLAGSGLAYRRTADGAYIVYPAPIAAAREPEPETPVALPELLVTGRKSQNSDIQRSENDIQAYKVWSSRDIEQAHSADIDDFLRARVTGNAQPTTRVAEAGGSNRSEVNLRGLGANQTLVLVDGRRMPGLPSLDWVVSILQADLNGVPLAAIDRIEVLNSTAGGIHGVGATAGAINLVLKRDYQGATFGVTYGASSRGDAAVARIDGRAGFSTDDGRTQGMLFFSRNRGADLRDGNRDFTARARAVRAANDPVGFARSSPISSSINIVSRSGADLTLDPRYGGTSLGAASTFVAATYGGVASDGGAQLLANAGRADPSLAPDPAGERRSLLTHPVATSLLANGRHRFGTSVEAYLDFMFFQNTGEATLRRNPRSPTIAANAPTNPFQQDILVSFPLEGIDGRLASKTRTARLTGGLIVDLPRAWKADLDYSWGRAQLREHGSGTSLNDAFYVAIRNGLPTAGGAAVDPLAGQSALQAAIAPFKFDSQTSGSQTNRFGDLSLRLAGPLMQAPGGPVTLSMLAETRSERVPSATYHFAASGPDAVLSAALPTVETRTRSVYAELRAPIIDRDAGPPGLKGLELQLAVRRDAARATFEGRYFDPYRGDTPPVAPSDSLTVYTVGLKVFPHDGLMVRASAASGVLPPPLDRYGVSTYFLTADPDALESELPVFLMDLTPPDPKRGGTQLGTEGTFELIYGGAADLKAERAESLSFGVVIMPPALERFRLSIDYTRIAKRREIVNDHAEDYTYILQHEDQLPGRVTRAPLTAADRAKGYAAGLVTAIDTTSFNIGRTWVEAVDFQVDYRVPTQTLGDFQFHAATTWQSKLTRRANADSMPSNVVGFSDGPLEWRGNGGIDWSRGPLTLGLNAVYYDSYRVEASDDIASVAASKILQQGAGKIPAQVYFDIYGVRRWAFVEGRGLRSIEVRFGIQNLLDHRPPLIATLLAPNFSPYGDPRLRRFELNLVGRF